MQMRRSKEDADEIYKGLYKTHYEPIMYLEPTVMVQYTWSNFF